MTSQYPLPPACHSTAFPHSRPRSLSLLGPQVSCPLHLGKSRSENRSGRGGLSALQGWTWAAAALSAPPRRCLSTKCPSGLRVRLPTAKGNPGLPSFPTLWPFQQIQGPWGGEEYLGKEWGRDRQWAKTPRLPREGDCFLTVYDVGPTSASVSSLDNWDRVTMDITLDRI